MKKNPSKRTLLEPRETDFSAFFRHKSVEEQRRVLEEVVRKANEDQYAILEEYDKRFAKSVSH